MKQRGYIFSFIIAFMIVTISPIFDSVLVTNYNQVEHHRLGFPLPIIEQHTTLTPLNESFPFKLGLLDPREHPTDILFFNYLLSIVSIAIVVFIVYWLLNKLILPFSKGN
ncbi:hypothetical protein [Neobacillus sp. D3-1R]|uniref:hypothetical protein n=1 Tax=Neobacillus sp. D3-1R TaxID=3445778 RepID=UPI003F9ECA2F